MHLFFSHTLIAIAIESASQWVASAENKLLQNSARNKPINFAALLWRFSTTDLLHVYNLHFNMHNKVETYATTRSLTAKVYALICCVLLN